MRRKVEYFFLSSVWLQQAKGSGSFGSFTCDAANYSRFSKAAFDQYRRRD
jgi:hypothetical protein